MLHRSSQLRNSSVFTNFHSDSSAPARSATGEYGTVPERPGGNEEQSSRNEEQTKNTFGVGPSIIQAMRSQINCSY